MTDKQARTSGPHQLKQENLDPLLRDLERIEHELPDRVNADPDDAAKGLVQLVLTLVDLLRELMERQAVRRMEGGSLSEEEIEQLGQTFQKLDQRMDELRKHFDLEKDDLQINLGSFGRLL